MLDVPLQYSIYSYEHQQVVSLLLRKIGNYFESKQLVHWEILPAIKINESETSPVPDLSICYDTEPKIIIEVVDNSSEGYNFNKLAKLVSEHNLAEAFIYNYQSKRWRKFSKKDGEIEGSSSFCETLDYYLNNFLK